MLPPLREHSRQMLPIVVLLSRETWKWLSALPSCQLAHVVPISDVEGSRCASLETGRCLRNLLDVHVSRPELSWMYSQEAGCIHTVSFRSMQADFLVLTWLEVKTPAPAATKMMWRKRAVVIVKDLGG